MSFTHDQPTVRYKGLRSVTTISILTLVRSATTSTVCAQSGSSKIHENGGTYAKRISFKGYLQGSETDMLQGSPPDAVMVDGNVTGIATHLSQYTFTYKTIVKLPEDSATGSAELIAAGRARGNSLKEIHYADL